MNINSVNLFASSSSSTESFRRVNYTPLVYVEIGECVCKTLENSKITNRNYAKYI